MRQIVYSTIAVTAICLSLTACQNEIAPDAPKDCVMTMTVQASQANTRTAITVDDQGNYDTAWKKDDQIWIYELSDGEYALGESEPLGNDADAITSFNVRFEDEPEGTSFQYVGVYPRSSDFGVSLINSANDPEGWSEAWGSVPSTSRWGLIGTMAFWQSPKDGSFDPRADLMFSRITSEVSDRPSSLSMSFARVGTIVKITLTGLEGDIVDSGCLRAGESWLASGLVYYDPIEEKVSYQPAPIKGMDDFSSIISFQPDNVRVDSDGNAVIWLRTMSGELTDHFTIEVTTFETPETGDGSWTNQRDYRKVVDLASKGKSIIFDEGGITAFKVEMEEVQPDKYFTFSEETLKYFPELANEEPVIRFPKDYYVRGIKPFKFPFEVITSDSDPEWTVSCSFEDDVQWLEVITEDNSTYLKAKNNYMYDQEATLTLSFTNHPEISPIEIPVEGFNIVTFKSNGEVYNWHYEYHVMEGEEVTISADFQLPSWMHLYDENYPLYWDDYGYGSISQEGRNTWKVQSLEEDENYIVYFTLWYNTDFDTANWKYIDYTCYFWADPFYLPMIFNGRDVSGGSLNITPGETITLKADLSSVPESCRSSLSWSTYAYDGTVSYSTNTSIPYSVDIKGLTNGFVDMGYSVKIDEKVYYYSMCSIQIVPITMAVNGVYQPGGTAITMSLGQEITLKASVSDQSYSTVHWDVAYGDDDTNYEYIEGTGDIVRLSYTSDPLEAKIRAVNYGNDRVSILLKDSGGEDLYYYVIPVEVRL